MKKFFVVIIFLFSVFVCYGQNGTWTFCVMEADELLGRKESYAIMYKEGDKTITYWSNDGLVRISFNGGIFDYENNPYFGEVVDGCIIGLYENDELIYKITPCYFHIVNNDANHAYFYNSNKETCQTVADYLINFNCTYVRIVAPKYSGGNFDIKCPSYSKWCKDNNVENKVAKVTKKELEARREYMTLKYNYLKAKEKHIANLYDSDARKKWNETYKILVKYEKDNKLKITSR